MFAIIIKYDSCFKEEECLMEQKVNLLNFTETSFSLSYLMKAMSYISYT